MIVLAHGNAEARHRQRQDVAEGQQREREIFLIQWLAIGGHTPLKARPGHGLANRTRHLTLGSAVPLIRRRVLWRLAEQDQMTNRGVDQSHTLGLDHSWAAP